MLLQGPRWEQSTASILASLTQKSSLKKKKFMKKRLGSKAAKRQEALDNVGEVLNDHERTLFRALAARSLYLSMDRPDTMYSSKELCRDFAQPTRHSVIKLKRVVRYLVTRPRCVWHFGVEDSSTVLEVFSDTDFGG